MMSAGVTDSAALNNGILFLRDWKLMTRFVIGVLFRPCGKEVVALGEETGWQWGRGEVCLGVDLNSGGGSLGGSAGVHGFGRDELRGLEFDGEVGMEAGSFCFESGRKRLEMWGEVIKSSKKESLKFGMPQLVHSQVSGVP